MNRTAFIPRTILLFALIFSLLLLLLQTWQPHLLYQRESILAGEVWRLWTASLVHTNIPHLLLNLSGFWIFLLLCAPVLTLKFLISSIIFSATAIGFGLLLLNPQLAWYAGFSGVQYGLFLSGGVYLIMSGDKFSGIALIILVVGKLVFDGSSNTDQLSQQMIGARVVQQAHWYGAAAGLLATLPNVLRALRPKQQE